MNEAVPGVNPQAFSARISGIYTPAESGQMVLGLASSGRCRLLVDGKLAIDNWTYQEKGDSFMGMGSSEQTVVLKVTAGTPLALVMEFSKQEAGIIAGVRLGSTLLPPDDGLQQAAALAGQAEVALVFVGTNGEWESEGADKPDLELPGSQAALIEAVTAANPNTVVVLQTGSPVAMPWLERAGAVLQAWFPGQECGNAIADVVFGKQDASGRLSQTFPMRLEDNPAYINYPGENGKVHYGEGIFVGYRYYEKKNIVPLFPFGFGLSYTSFAYTNLRLNRSVMAPGETLTVSVDVTNAGPRAGMEVVQLYVRDERSQVQRPEKELKGFAKIDLLPDETRTVTFQIGQEALAFFDEGRHCWMAEAGAFEGLLGSSSRQIRAAAAFTLSADVIFGGQPQTALRLTLDSTVKELLASEAAVAVVERHIPGAAKSFQAEMAQSFTLRQLSAFEPNVFNQMVMQAIAADLEKI